MMSEQVNPEDSYGNNESSISRNEATSLETEAAVIEDYTFTSFDFIEETLQITDVCDAFDVSISADKDVNLADESASCFDQPCSPRSISVNQFLKETPHKMDLNCTQETENQYNDKLHSVSFNSFNSSLKLDPAMAETNMCDASSQLVVENESSRFVNNTSEFNDLVCQDIEDFLGKSIDKQHLNDCGDTNVICSEVVMNKVLTNSQNFTSQSSPRGTLFPDPLLKLDEINKEDQNTIDYDGNEKTVCSQDILSMSVSDIVLTPQNKIEGGHEKDAKNFTGLYENTFVVNQIEEIGTANGSLENPCTSSNSDPNYSTSGHLEKKLDSASYEMTQIVDSENKGVEIMLPSEPFDLQLMNQSFDNYSTSTKESNSDIFEDAVDSTKLTGYTTTEINETRYNYDEASFYQDEESGTERRNKPSFEATPNFPDDTYSSDINASHVYTSDSSLLSNPSVNDSFEGSYLIQEPLVILETDDCNSSNKEAESFALTEVRFLQLSSLNEDEDTNLEPHGTSSFSNITTDLDSNDASVGNINGRHNISNAFLSPNLHCMKSVQTSNACDIENQLELSEILQSPINASIVIDNNTQGSKIFDNIKPSTSEELFEDFLVLNNMQQKHHEVANDVSLHVETIDKGMDGEKSLPFSFEIVEVLESKLDSKKLLKEIEKDGELLIEQSMNVHESSSNQSCSKENGYTNFLDTSTINQTQKQNQSSETLGLNCTDFKPSTSEEFLEDILVVDNKQQHVEIIDKGTGGEKSLSVSFEVIDVLETKLDSKKPLIENDGELSTDQSLNVHESGGEKYLPVSFEVIDVLKTKLDSKKPFIENNSDLSNDQSMNFHESSSNESCNTENCCVLEISKTNQIQKQNQHCQNSETSSLNGTNFFNSIFTNEINDFSSDVDQKSSDTLEIIKSPMNKGIIVSDVDQKSSVALEIIKSPMNKSIIVSDNNTQGSEIFDDIKPSTSEELFEDILVLENKQQEHNKAANDVSLHVKTIDKGTGGEKSLPFSFEVIDVLETKLNLKKLLIEDDGELLIGQSMNVHESISSESCSTENGFTNFLDTSKTNETQKQNQSCQYSETSSFNGTDFINNTITNETNDFSSEGDQKSSDAVYIISSSDSNENSNQSLTDHGLQSFMEMTMANFNPVMYEQSMLVNQTGKQSTLHNVYNECSLYSQEYNKPLCRAEEEIKTSDVEVLDPSFQSEFNNSPENISHEIMQQSMCDYVTTQVLHLTIPDEDKGEINYSNRNEHEQCEKQTENVLLMKWPPKFYDQLKTLQEQNILLSKQVDLGLGQAVHINNIEERNKVLVEKLEDQLKLINEDQLIITELQNQNKHLSVDLDYLKAIENDLLVHKTHNEELKQNIQTITREKECELKAMSDKIEELQQQLTFVGETVEGLQRKNDVLFDETKTKDEHIKILIEDKNVLAKNIKDINKRLEEFSELEGANKLLANAIEQEMQKTTEAEKLSASLQEQVTNLTSQNELLWNELKVSTTKEQALYVVNEEKLILEERLVLLKREVDELDKLKLGNKQLLEKLNGRDYDICNLTDDKKKLKNSLKKANDKLNALESENEYLTEVTKELKLKIGELNSQVLSLEDTKSTIEIEKQSLQITLNNVLKKEEAQNSLIECERIATQENVTSIGECITHFLLEKEWLNEQVYNNENQISNLEQENEVLKNRILNEETLLDCIQTKNINLVNQLDCLQNKVDYLTKELSIMESQTCSLINIQNENEQLSLQVKTLIESVTSFEDEKESTLKDMSRLSEAISNVLMDKEMLSNQLKEASIIIEKLINEKKQLEQQASSIESTINEFKQSESTLLIQLQNANLKDEVVESQDELIRELEMHISSLNEELFNEISNQELLELDNIGLNSQIGELKLTNSLLYSQSALVQEKDQAVNDLKINQQYLNKLIEELSEKSRILQEENCVMKEELEKSKEAINNLRNSILNLSNQLESKSNETNTLVLQVENLEQQNCKLELCSSSLKSELENSKAKDFEINELKDLMKELEQHVSSLNEELLSEMIKHDFVMYANKNLEYQSKEIEKEKCDAIATLNTVSDSVHHLKCENSSLKTELQDTVLELRNENYNLVQAHREVELKLKSVFDEKNYLESKLFEKVKLLEGNEGPIERIHGQECGVKDHFQLREVMLKEINSLSGSNQLSNLESLSLVEVYQTLMTEFLSKEREVISTLQNDYDDKKTAMQKEVTNLQHNLEDKESLSFKLEQEIKELKQQISENKVTTSELNSCLQDKIDNLKNKEKEIAEVKEVLIKVGQEKEELIAEMKCSQHPETESKLVEEVLFLNNEVQCKNIEMSDLTNEIEQLKIKEGGFVKLLEKEKENVHLHQENVNILNKELNNKQESISNLEIQLLNKASEVEQLHSYLESKKKEKEEYEKKVEELSPAAVRLSQIKDDIDTIENLFLMNKESDLEKVLIEAAQSCRVLGSVMKAILEQCIKYVSKIQLSKTDIDSQLLKSADECSNLNSKVNCLNEELKAYRILYDEDILQLKEEVVSKNQTISKMSDENKQLKLDHFNMLEQIKSVENECLKVDQLKQEVEELKGQNLKLVGDYSKFNVFKEVNRKLSLEIEELSRSIKFEKQSNNDLKAKYDLVCNQLAESKKNYFGLEDKIEVLENKLQNLMKSIKVAFPVGIDDIDKQVVFINEQLEEYNKQKKKLQHLIEENSLLKHDYDKSSEYIKKQEEKMSKILKRELDLKKQIASVNQTNTNESKHLEKVKAELFSFFPEQPTSFPEAFVKVKNLLEESKFHENVNPKDIEELRKRLEEAQQENKDLDNECEMTNKHLIEQEEQLKSVLRREEELKKENKDLKAKLCIQMQPHKELSEASLTELLLAFPEKPTTIKSAIDLIKTTFAKNKALTEKMTESQEEFASLDKECEEMFKAYQLKEKELEDVLKREAKSALEFEAEAVELQNKVHSLKEELEKSKSEKLLIPPATCQCDELRSRLTELKVDLADRNAKITALELQFEADNFPIKRKASDLEKSLDQAKQKINELKAEVRRYQEQMHEVTVGLRADCESCRRNNTTRSELSVQTSPAADDYGDQLAQKTKEIAILKALCKARNQRIAELEQGSVKVPRPHRSALKPGKENANLTLSPTKSSKGNNAF